LAKKQIITSLIIGIVIGSLGSYFSHDLLSFFGIDQSMLSFIDKEKLEVSGNQEFPKLLVTNDLHYKLIDVKNTDFGINGEKPLAGGIFLISKVEIENFGKEEVIVYGKNWKLKDENNRIYSPKTFDATPEKNENVFSIRIPPGFKIIKNIGFEIPSDIESSRQLYVANKPFDSEPILLGII